MNQRCFVFFMIEIVHCITSFSALCSELNSVSYFKNGTHVKMIIERLQLQSLWDVNQNDLLLIKLLPSGGGRKKGKKKRKKKKNKT